MIVTKCKKGAEGYWGEGLGLVVAIINHDGTDDYIIRSPLFVDPLPYKLEDLEIIDDETPSDWIKVSHGNNTVYSFPEWAKDKYYYGQLVDDYDPDKTRLAHEVLENKVKGYIEDFAVKKFGSIIKAKEYQLSREYDEKVKLSKENGYEQPDRVEITEQLLKETTLTLDTIYS